MGGRADRSCGLGLNRPCLSSKRVCVMFQAAPASAASLWAAAKRWRGHIEKFLAAGDPLTFSMMSAMMCGSALRGRFVESASAPLTAFVSNWGCTGIVERYCVDEVRVKPCVCV